MNKFLLGAAVAVLAASAALPLPAHAQRNDNRPAVAVTDFRNQTSAGWWGGGVGHELAIMLSNELAATRAFRMVDRKNLNATLAEQDLAASGRVRQGSGPRTGNLTGAHYLVQGTVTAFEQNTSSTGGGFSFKGIQLGGKRTEAYIAVDLQVVDSETGEIAYVRTVEGRSSGGGIKVGLYRGGFGGTLGHENNTPTGKAIRAALVEATDYLACEMVYQDSCRNTYNAREQRRRQSNRDVLDLD